MGGVAGRRGQRGRKPGAHEGVEGSLDVAFDLVHRVEAEHVVERLALHDDLRAG